MEQLGNELSLTASFPNGIALHCHAKAPCGAVRTVHATAKRDTAVLNLKYEIVGDIAALKIPTPLPAARCDELWRHTCAEAFIAVADAKHYCEFNFSPSSQWAAYQFTDYRQGRQRVSCDAPFMTLSVENRKLVLAVRFALPEWYTSHAVQLGLCMVIEDNNEQCSYWALRHDSPRADFHRRENWIYTV